MTLEWGQDSFSKSGTHVMAKCNAYPRGRVIFYHDKKTFRLYADKCLKTNDLKAIQKEFGLEGLKVEIEGDEHYQCDRCNIYFMDLKSPNTQDILEKET